MSAIDVWAQITTARMEARPWMETLMRWTGKTAGEVPTLQSTIDAMDEADVEIALLSAWHGPEGSLISNEEVLAHIEAAPNRFRGLASVDLYRPMEAVRDIRRWIDKKELRWRSRCALALGSAAQ